jgi:hypothetical protein
MRNLFTAVLLILSLVVFGQDYNFKPNWTVGDVKHVSITEEEKSFENDKLISDTLKKNKAVIRVLEESKTHYTLEITMDNQALTSVIEFYNKLGDELKDYNDLVLVYAIDKLTAERELTNWEEAQEFMNESFEQIDEVLEEKVPEMAGMSGIIFGPLKEAFRSKENTEAYMEPHIDYLLVPFNKDFVIGKTISQVDTADNPFNPRQEISATTNVTLKSVEANSNTCTIEQEVILDLEEFIAMMKDMVMQMAKAFGGEEGLSEEKQKEIDSFNMDMENVQTITFDYKTTWVTQAVGRSTIKTTNPKDGTRSRKEVTITRIVK